MQKHGPSNYRYPKLSDCRRPGYRHLAAIHHLRHPNHLDDGHHGGGGDLRHPDGDHHQVHPHQPDEPEHPARPRRPAPRD